MYCTQKFPCRTWKIDWSLVISTQVSFLFIKVSILFVTRIYKLWNDTIIRIWVGHDLKSVWTHNRVMQCSGYCLFVKFPKWCSLAKLRGRAKFFLLMGKKDMLKTFLLYAILFINASGIFEPLCRYLLSELRKLENFKHQNLGSACSNFTVLMRTFGFILDNLQNMG